MALFKYADPPYYGMCAVYEHHHPDGRCWDDLGTHARLIEHLVTTADGWAMSLQSPALKPILALCPDDVRIGSWCKTFASFKKGVNPAFAWEPVIFRGARTAKERADLLGVKYAPTVRDWVATPITLQRGFVGAKPRDFAFWIFDLLGMVPEDDFEDVFTGSGAVGRAWDTWRTTRPLLLPEEPSEAVRMFE